MAPRKTQQQEAMEAGERNVVPGQSWLAALIRGIGREMQGSQGTPFGQATREELGSLGYEQMLREQYPEEFARGRLYGSEMFPTDIASFYAARPGRSTFSPAMAVAEGRSAPMALEAPAARLAYTPVAEAPVAAAPRGSFDANMMSAFRRGEVGSRPAGRPQAFRPEDFLAIEQGPFAQSPNAFEGNMVMATRRGVPSPSPANYDYQGPAMPGPMTNRPVSGFDRNMLDWARAGRTPPTRTGTFREGDFPPYSPEEMGQAIGPYRAQTQVQPQGVGGANYPHRPGPVGFQLLPPYERGGLPTMARGGEIPYGEFRDVTGHVLPAPPPGAAPRYTGSMDFGVTREGPAAESARLHPAIKALIAGAAADAGLRGGYNALFGERREENPFVIDYRGFGMRGRDGMATPRLTDFYPVEPMAMTPQGGMEALPVTAPPSAPAAAARTSPPAAARTARAKPKAEPLPPRRPADLGAEPAWEGNLNYYVTQALDRLTGQDEAGAGRRYQEYYATHPWPY